MKRKKFEYMIFYVGIPEAMDIESIEFAVHLQRELEVSGRDGWECFQLDYLTGKIRVHTKREKLR